MGPIIVDTSVWVDALRGIKNAQVQLIIDYTVTGQFVNITPTILQEVLQGIRE